MSFSFSNSGNVENQLSKYSWWFWYFGNSCTRWNTNPSAHPALPVPAYMKKSYMLPDCPAHTISLNQYLWIFFRLHCRILPALLVFAGITGSLMHCASSVSTFKKFWRTSLSNGLTLNNCHLCFQDSLWWCCLLREGSASVICISERNRWCYVITSELSRVYCVSRHLN